MFLLWLRILSAKQLYLDNNITVTFLPNSFNIKDLSTGTLILKGGVEDGLYKLPASPHLVHPSQVSCTASSSSPFGFARIIHTVNGSFWHDRLDHPHQAVLDLILKGMDMVVQPNTSYSLYNACQMGKSHRLRLIVAHHRSVIPFVILHVDIWRPPPVKWNALFVDDCTKYK